MKKAFSHLKKFNIITYMEIRIMATTYGLSTITGKSDMVRTFKTAGEGLEGGYLVSLDSTGLVVKSNLTTPTGVIIGEDAKKTKIGEFQEVTVQSMDVWVKFTGTLPLIGGLAYLSSVTAGTVTEDPISTIVVGKFVSTEDNGYIRIAGSWL